MAQAVNSNSTSAPAIQPPTRRRIFTAASALVVLSPLTLTAGRARLTDAEFVRCVESLFDNGGLAARHAMAAGMRPEWLFCILNPSWGGPLDTPGLLFCDPAGGHHTFRPYGRDAR
jgi:hypothetical protein